ncbi:MOSC domain-containing protein [Marinomonas algarum]|uniref:MOSC domain-containing protein n=1 Tax=Marinomonas algarum TaxID=2883105 RepID=A0A9X1IQ53_9GAMM|nr:MOSC domain-containing protein [Marinomonas algarum]MCB5161888.1 MOSC domain-containing protein [Marinomonas algarum]
MSFFLSALNIYPIKSIKGIKIDDSIVRHDGLVNDRRFVLVTPDGQFISGREYPDLTLVSASQVSPNQWQITHPEMTNSLLLNETLFLEKYKNVTVWEDSLSAQQTQDNANDWFSTLLGTEVELLFFGEQSKRYTSRRPDEPVGFADGYPFLLTTQASLDELNRTCPEVIAMSQFRPNIVVEGNEAFAEDSWKRIRIGEVEFENVKPCIRCIFTTLDPLTAKRIGRGEPLKTLGKFRLLNNQEGITFGINLIALNTGHIHLNDPVEILEYQKPDVYLDRR